ncbi:hypothetical protein [Actinoplanes sp. TFC3]|nr:hypothetical protein [Actinoplanes sp. TFC3]
MKDLEANDAGLAGWCGRGWRDLYHEEVKMMRLSCSDASEQLKNYRL